MFFFPWESGHVACYHVHSWQPAGLALPPPLPDGTAPDSHQQTNVLPGVKVAKVLAHLLETGKIVDGLN